MAENGTRKTPYTTLAIVTPWHNQPDLWWDYTWAVRYRRPRDQVIVVDNGSDPPLPFTAIRSATNLGFSGGSNLGLHHATADAVLFLNNDIVALDDDWLEDIRERVEPGVLVGPLRQEPWAVVDGEMYPYIDGWCLAGMREDLLALGGFDESLEEPAYYSDNLLCLAARRSGMTLRDVRPRLRHLEGTTARHHERYLDVAVGNRQRYLASVRGVPAASTR